MTKDTLSHSPSGETVLYQESDEDRRKRLLEAERKYAVRYTQAQRTAVGRASRGRTQPSAA